MVLTLCGVLFSFAMYAQNETVNGELTVNGKTTISTNSDAIISLLNTDNSWQYIQFLQSGTRKAYVGLDASNNFVLAKENGGNFYFTGGNLGLGVYNPTVKLDVDGSIKATGTFTAGYGHFKDASDAPLRIESTDAYSGIRFKDPFNSGYLWYNGQNETFAIGGNGSNVNGKKLHVAGGTSIGVAYEGSPIPANGLAIQGNLGVGTSSAFSKISLGSEDPNVASRIAFYEHVNDGTRFRGIGMANPDPANFIYGVGIWSLTGPNSPTDTNMNMFIADNGKVGIGTANPQTKLNVTGAIQAGLNTDSYFSQLDPNGLIFNRAGTSYIDFKDDANSLSFRQGSSYSVVMHLASSGNVGIGTTTPDAKLAVNGTIHTKEVKVDLTGWPDYVFAKEYDLLSVEEVADFIKKNGHLPKMPSAATVEKDGVLLGDMNKKLLEKIEELTLYTIEQEKKIKALEQQNKRIEQLEAQMKKLLSGKE